jgi:CubicO group peptidase (beta-lactamase class C family)
MDAAFELGSVTKTITGVLLATMVVSNDLRLDEPIGDFIDAGANASITLRELATHTSGLPRLAPNLEAGAFSPTDPYAVFTADRAEAALQALDRSDAGNYEYSNFGYQVLGLLLERASGLPYADLAGDRVFTPLEMTATNVGGAPTVVGHASGRDVPAWTHALPGAGGVTSTATDLGRYLTATLRPPANDLGAAIELALQPHGDIDANRESGLGWIIIDRRRWWHNGATGGFATSIAIEPSANRGIGLLANATEAVDALDAAVMLSLNGRDVSSARPTNIAPKWEQTARAAATALVTKDAKTLHGMMASQFQKSLPQPVLKSILAKALFRAGQLEGLDIRCRRIPGGIAADVNATLQRRQLDFTLAFAANGEIAGLKLLDPGEQPPW